jgi:hypothetical protein
MVNTVATNEVETDTVAVKKTAVKKKTTRKKAVKKPVDKVAAAEKSSLARKRITPRTAVSARAALFTIRSTIKSRIFYLKVAASVRSTHM